MRVQYYIYLCIGVIISSSVITYNMNKNTLHNSSNIYIGEIHNINKNKNLATSVQTTCDTVLDSPFASYSQCSSQEKSSDASVDFAIKNSSEEEKKSHAVFITELFTKMERNDIDAMREYAAYATTCKQFSSSEGSRSSYCDLSNFTHQNHIFLKSAASAAALGSNEASLILAKWHLAELDLIYSKSQASTLDDSAFFDSVAFKEKMKIVQAYMQPSNVNLTSEGKILQYRLANYNEFFNR